MSLKTAVIAGTVADTQMGADWLRERDPSLEIHDYNVSATPDEQHLFQYGDISIRTARMTEIFRNAEEQGIRNFFIYCNSLSGSFDFESFCRNRGDRVATPLMVYRGLAARYRRIALLAANTQSAFRIDEIMHRENPQIDVIGLGMLELVRAVENRMPPQEIMERYRMAELMQFLEASGAEGIILGCTHFPWFRKELSELTRLPLIDPAERMYELLFREN
ncbi:MAG: aspartate/glutamate racemase family protein [Solobacterium sp.]|nr:aspartate/glutamate racemase family protein [Solobacterium sp.]